jgi:rhodanese-related sulfurtransferase
MGRRLHFLVSCITLFLVSSVAMAQYPVITSEEVTTWMTGTSKVVLIDTRMRDEYRKGHIPGAVNIPAESMKGERARLPKVKSTPIIFYCRGMS